MRPLPFDGAVLEAAGTADGEATAEAPAGDRDAGALDTLSAGAADGAATDAIGADVDAPGAGSTLESP